MVVKVARTDANILITGENGTGKEMLAQEIHRLSTRREHTMVTVDMGAISESLFESELFGHERGSFTDAYESRPGKFEAASGSSLFMDEIGNLPLAMQAKLLTVLQNRKLHASAVIKSSQWISGCFQLLTRIFRRWWIPGLSVRTYCTD